MVHFVLINKHHGSHQTFSSLILRHAPRINEDCESHQTLLSLILIHALRINKNCKNHQTIPKTNSKTCFLNQQRPQQSLFKSLIMESTKTQGLEEYTYIFVQTKAKYLEKSSQVIKYK